MPASSDRPAEFPRQPNGRPPVGRPSDGRPTPHLATGADAEPDALPTDALRRRRALDAVRDALGQTPRSLEAVRAAAVRFGHLARDAGLGPDEMAAALVVQVRRAAVPLGPADLAQLGASVAWWGAHGYHRAD